MSVYSNDMICGGTTFQFSMRMETDSIEVENEAKQQQKEQRRPFNDQIAAI